MVAVTASFVAVVMLVVAAFVALRPDPAPLVEGPGPGLTSTQGGSPTPESSATPTPTQTATPTPSATTPRPPRVTHTEVPIPSQKPPEVELPPPPPPAPPGPPPSAEPTSCTQWDPEGDASPEVVRAALAEAGARQNWREGVSLPNGWPGGPYPPITIPAALMNAIAFTESSWRSTVIACDGGIGLMQVMPDTAPWMNQRFRRSDDVTTVDGNAAIGAMYLQWLTMYFGLYYFGSFDHDTVAPLRDGGGDIRLGDVVIAAYNVGYGAVEHRHGTDDPDDDTLSIPNQWYVDRVKNYRASCPCDRL